MEHSSPSVDNEDPGSVLADAYIRRFWVLAVVEIALCIATWTSSWYVETIPAIKTSWGGATTVVATRQLGADYTKWGHVIPLLLGLGALACALGLSRRVWHPLKFSAVNAVLTLVAYAALSLTATQPFAMTNVAHNWTQPGAAFTWAGYAVVFSVFMTAVHGLCAVQIAKARGTEMPTDILKQDFGKALGFFVQRREAE